MKKTISKINIWSLYNRAEIVWLVIGFAAGFILGYIAGGAMNYSESNKMVAGLISMVLTFALEIFISPIPSP